MTDMTEIQKRIRSIKWVQNTKTGTVAQYLNTFTNQAGQEVCECKPLLSRKSTFWTNFKFVDVYK